MPNIIYHWKQSVGYSSNLNKCSILPLNSNSRDVAGHVSPIPLFTGHIKHAWKFPPGYQSCLVSTLSPHNSKQRPPALDEPSTLHHRQNCHHHTTYNELPIPQWFHLNQHSPASLQGGGPRTFWGDYVSPLAREHLGIPMDELEVCPGRGKSGPLCCPRDPAMDKVGEDGWLDGWMVSFLTLGPDVWHLEELILQAKC